MGTSDPFKSTQDVFKNNNLRKLWVKMRDKAIADVKAIDPKDAKDLAAKFDKALDGIAGELKRRIVWYNQTLKAAGKA